HVCHAGLSTARDADLEPDRFRNGLRLARGTLDKTVQEERQVCQADHVVRHRPVQCCAWHLREGGIVRILHYGDASALLDRLESRSPIAEGAGQHDADRAWATTGCDRTQHGVDRGADVALPRAFTQPQSVAISDQMTAGRREENLSFGEWITI